MVEKKATVKKVARKATTAKTTTKSRPAAKKAEITVDAENAGFRAGDVYQALSAAGVALSVAELTKATSKTETEVLLGISASVKEEKVKAVDGRVVLD